MTIRISSIPADLISRGHGRMNRDTMDFIRDRKRDKMRSWTSRARDKFERVRDDILGLPGMEAMARRISSVAGIIKSRVTAATWAAIRKLNELQNAPDQMLDYLGANTTFRRKYRRNECDGWSGRYKDDQPDLDGEDNYYYRRVTDGICLKTEDGRMETNVYFDVLKDGDRHLDIDEQEDCRRLWEMMEYYFSLGKEDPTSKWNARLT